MNKWITRISIIIIVILLGLLFFQQKEYTAKKGNLDIIILAEIQTTFASIVYEHNENILTPERLKMYNDKLSTLSRICGQSENLHELTIYLCGIDSIKFDSINDEVIAKYTSVVEALIEFNQLVYSVEIKEHGGRGYKLLQDKNIRVNIMDPFKFLNEY